MDVAVSPTSRSSRGLTAVEVVIALTIVALALALAAPTLKDYRTHQRMRSALALFVADLSAARSEAVQRGSRVVVCPVTEGMLCRDRATIEWQDGWLVFEDANDDRERQASEPVLRATPALAGLRVLGSRHRSRLRFFPNGTAPGSNASVTFCDARGLTYARQVSLSASGRIRLKTAEESDGGACQA